MVHNNLPQIGKNLQKARKKRFPNDNMKVFALRIGISRATYQKMEKGDLSVSLKHYYQAAKILGLEAGFSQLFLMQDSLFDD